MDGRMEGERHYYMFYVIASAMVRQFTTASVIYMSQGNISYIMETLGHLEANCCY